MNTWFNSFKRRLLYWTNCLTTSQENKEKKMINGKLVLYWRKDEQTNIFIRFFRSVQKAKLNLLCYLKLLVDWINHLKGLLWFFKRDKHYVCLLLNARINKMGFPMKLVFRFNRSGFKPSTQPSLNLIRQFPWFIRLYFKSFEHCTEISSKMRFMVDRCMHHHQNFQIRYIWRFNFIRLFTHIQDWRCYHSY